MVRDPTAPRTTHVQSPFCLALKLFFLSGFVYLTLCASLFPFPRPVSCFSPCLCFLVSLCLTLSATVCFHLPLCLFLYVRLSPKRLCLPAPFPFCPSVSLLVHLRLFPRLLCVSSPIKEGSTTAVSLPLVSYVVRPAESPLCPCLTAYQLRLK